MVRQVFRQEALISAVYVALCLRIPEINASGSSLPEPTSASYARAGYAIGGAYWGVTGYNEVYNTQTIYFPQAGNYWGLVVGYALCTASSGGDTLAVGALKTPLRVDLGATVGINSGGLAIGLFD